MRLIGSVAVLSLALVACNHEKTAVNPPAASPAQAAASAPARDVTKNQKMSHTLALSSDIVRLCGIKATASSAAPKFAFDRAELSEDDHAILQQLATCMRTGPLQGKGVDLIGRADRRGTEEYNLALGSRRAGSADDYLQALGVNKAQLAKTTRGALDATGTDESGWANDRRVDIMLRHG